MTATPTPSYSRVEAVYNGSNGKVTAELYGELGAYGALGSIAVNLFRANKNSVRAKKYKRRSSTGAAYDSKAWAMGNLEKLLEAHADRLGIVWGWKEDPQQAKHRWVLYIELPTGQVSFHQGHRGNGPDFPGSWCGEYGSADRIVALAAHILDGTKPLHVGGTPAPGAPVSPKTRQSGPNEDLEPALPFWRGAP